MNPPEAVVLLDSLGDILPSNKSPILVCGSHCGGNISLAKNLRECHIKAVFLNNAGVGKNQAGIQGLHHYHSVGVLACAVDHYSAEIGIAQDTWDSGIISHINALAESNGIQIGDSVQRAVKIIMSSVHFSTKAETNQPPSQDIENQTGLPHPEARNSTETQNIIGTQKSETQDELKQQSQTQIEGKQITLTDSITFLNETNAGQIVVCGSHGGLSAGSYARKKQVRVVFFNDAGIGKNDAGSKSLPILSDAGILACTVDCMSAEIFNGQDALENGIISACNPLAQSKGIHVNMTVKEAIRLI